MVQILPFKKYFLPLALMLDAVDLPLSVADALVDTTYNTWAHTNPLFKF